MHKEIEASEIGYCLSPSVTHAQYIAELQSLLSYAQLKTHTLYVGKEVAGEHPWKVGYTATASSNRIYSDFLYRLYDMFSVWSGEFVYSPTSFVEIEGTCYRCTPRKELRKSFRSGPWPKQWELPEAQVPVVLSRMEAHKVISLKHCNDSIYLRLNPGRVLELISELLERKKQYQKMQKRSRDVNGNCNKLES